MGLQRPVAFGTFVVLHMKTPAAPWFLPSTDRDVPRAAWAWARLARLRVSPSIFTTSGCALPSTRRAIRSVSSSVFTASRRSLSEAPAPSQSARP